MRVVLPFQGRIRVVDENQVGGQNAEDDKFSEGTRDEHLSQLRIKAAYIKTLVTHGIC